MGKGNFVTKLRLRYSRGLEVNDVSKLGKRTCGFQLHKLRAAIINTRAQHPSPTRQHKPILARLRGHL